MRKISPCAPAWGVLACEEDLRAQLFFLLKLIGVSGGIVCLRQGHKVRADGISGGEGGKPDVKEAGEAALPCPLGQGALGSLGATLLACGKGASGRRALVLPHGVFGAGGIFLRASRPVPRAGLTGADYGFLPHPHPGCFRCRRGYGGLCPHPLKDHWPLRIPLAAARFPNVTTNAGRLLRVSRPASASASAPNETQRSAPAPCSWGGRASLPRGSSGRAHCAQSVGR